MFITSKIIFEILLRRLLDGCITVNDEDYAVETLLEGEYEEPKQIIDRINFYPFVSI